MIKILFSFFLLTGAAVPSDHLVITLHGKPAATVTRAEVTRVFPGPPFIDPEQVDQFISKLNRTIYQAPQNATLDQHGGIAAEKPGVRLDQRAFRDRFYRYLFSRGPATVEAPLSPVYPKVDSELLSEIRVRPIGSYVTFFNAGNKSRSNNIMLATEAINNTVVFPNETFSFNQTVGRRTKEKGYLPARVIVRGEYSEGIGGGICQVSSTLFNAVDRAGLRITKRYSHSRRVGYVPPGRDATVDWYGPDFRFRNTYHQPILILAHKYGGSVSFSLYSSDTIHIKPKTIPDPSAKMPEEGHAGHKQKLKKKAE
ncbi:VanW family protein [Sporolactobacillus sp. Y61]|uniref:VanW family protein n=1 Tax=Sporolactobacillus sp. Y61 TaxID=3160863 RepID=A0AAU8IJR7_9BACL